MGKIILYGVDPSPPVRACKLILEALDLPYEYKWVDILKGEQLSADYLAKNPQHTIPTLDDDGHFLWDSHAIMAYLVTKYAKDDTLYPKDLLQRAVVDQRLHFESGVLFQGGLRNITAPLFRFNQTKVPQSQIDAIGEIYDFLESFLKDHKYMAGDNMTIADFSIITTVTTVKFFKDIDANEYPKLTAWIERMRQLPYFEEANEIGVRKFQKLMKLKNVEIVPSKL